MRNQDFLDMVSILSFMYGIANYQENLTQNDKADLMDKLDRQTRDILERLEKDIDEQNAMLKEILEMLKKEGKT